MNRPVVIAALAAALLSSLAGAARAISVRPVKSVLYGNSRFVSAPRGLWAVGRTVMFFAADGRRLGLWRSDGTAAGTLVVKEVVNPSGAVVANRTLFFTAGGFIDPAGQELWKSDGTREGTGLVKDIWPGSGASSPYPLVAVGGTLFFSASAPGSEGLWKSNGTEAGTVLVKAISPGGWGTDVNGTLFFDASDGVSGDELWKSDGTAAGTVLVKDIYPGPASSVAQRLVNVDGTVYFMAASHGEPYIAAASDLWKSDGTSEGTVAVKHIGLGWLRNVNGTLFFEGDDGVHGRELWTSDGTSAGTTMVRDINPGPRSSLPRVSSLREEVNGTFFFRADDGVHGYELWRSDGTAAGTRLVKDIRAGSPASYPNFLTDVNGTLFFTARDDTHGRELWQSNGTARGTRLVADINTRPNSWPKWLTNVNGTLMFVDRGGRHGRQLWETYPPIR